MTGEKMALFLALYRAGDFDEAMNKAIAIQNVMGAGHSLGLHSGIDERARRLAMEARTCRVIVNQAHCFANGGFFQQWPALFAIDGMRQLGRQLHRRESELAAFRQSGPHRAHNRRAQAVA
jgi:acyl-CoA reductase-like NAD-dependent aldehyde dehydrogenase